MSVFFFSMRCKYSSFSHTVSMDLMISSGISIMSLADLSLVGKYSETMVGLEILVGLQWRMQTFR